MIAIKMDNMPNSCSECPMFYEGWAKYFCSITWLPLSYPDYCKRRHKACPLIEVIEE